jgi:DNA-binding XRE family transcriptional regulator
MEKTKRSGTPRSLNSELTPGEKLLVWRRRKGWDQTRAAKHYKVSIFTLKLAEYGKAKNFPYKPDLEILLEDHEKCFIYRKRSKKTQPQLAREYGCGKFWIQLQEHGKVDCSKLLKWWEQQIHA